MGSLRIVFLSVHARGYDMRVVALRKCPLRRGEPLLRIIKGGTLERLRRHLLPLRRSIGDRYHPWKRSTSRTLALQSASYEEVEDYPLDVLGAQTEGMTGYMMANEMGNSCLWRRLSRLSRTMAEVDPDDPLSKPNQTNRPNGR